MWSWLTSQSRYLYYQKVEPPFILAEDEEEQRQARVSNSDCVLPSCKRARWTEQVLILSLLSTWLLLVAFLLSGRGNRDWLEAISLWCK